MMTHNNQLPRPGAPYPHVRESNYQRADWSSYSGTSMTRQPKPPKDKFIALMLSIFLGPFGLFYSTPVGALTMLAIWLFVVIPLCFFIVGFLLAPIAMVAESVWAVWACDHQG